jgi:putative acetyltransferase
MNVIVRQASPVDGGRIAEVNRLAFGQVAEAALVAGLRDGGFVRVELVAEVDGEVVGHILFGAPRIMTEDGGFVQALSLAPMAVRPDHQRCGIGSRLVEAGLATCREFGHRIIVVLGHPEFYPRFGFSQRLAEGLGPFSGAAWMAIELVPGAMEGVRGTVEYPEPFRAVGA